jgi:protoporphyrinogen oxidase
MKIAVIGGGFTGLTAAYELTRAGHEVSLFERDDHLGGLAYGFKASNWEWHLEAAYHHLFTNDHAILGLLKQVGLEDKILITRPITANLYRGKTYQFDSPAHLLGFPYLSFIDKVRTGFLALFCKVFPFWQPLEHITAKQFAQSVGGKKAWKIIWEPLMNGKFGTLADSVAASWLWARIHKRTSHLAYIEGGFQSLVNTLSQTIKRQGGKILTKTAIAAITPIGKNLYSVSWEDKTQQFDRILLTTPTPIAFKLLPQIQTSPALTIPHLHAQVLILETDKPILRDTYWLSVTDSSYPFLAVVAHTNFMDKAHYGNRHITYIGNYLPPDHPYLKMTKEQLLKKFWPNLQKINPHLTSQEVNLRSYLFVGPFAQPVHQINYSKKAPTLHTTLPGVYLANMDSIYPWDRGTNYAVELGQSAARSILSES